MIIINVSVFVVSNLISFIFLGGDESWISDYLAIPTGLTDFLLSPWTALTYMFLHAGIWHILWNMLYLYWFGRIFQEMIGPQRLMGVYFLGGFAGALLYLVVYNLIYLVSPGFGDGYMVGASAAVMAVMVATATRFPDFVVHLMFFGAVRLKYIVLVLFIMTSLIDITLNLGGNMAHIGGAAFGFFYIKGLDLGKDWAMDFYQFFDRLRRRMTTKEKTRMKVVHRKKEKKQKMRSAGSSKTAASSSEQEIQARLDSILDKISRTGYENLSKEEKAFLFKVSNRN